MKSRRINQIDSEANRLLLEEEKRQQNTLNLIASENYPSKAVLSALGSVLDSKYAEGYPKKRYYAGNLVIDKVEKLAQKRALQLFLPKNHRDKFKVNVQPYSGSPANIVVYAALLGRGDKVLAMDLSQGGHLTHGAKVNFSGKFWNFSYYGVDRKTEKLDYNQILSIAKKEKPKLIVCGATAYPREIDFRQFSQIAQKVGAILMADISHIAGLIVGGVHSSPFPTSRAGRFCVDVVTSTTHKTLRGPRSAFIISKNKLAKRIDQAVFPGLQGGPHENEILAKAICFKEASRKEFKNYAQQVVKNAQVLAEGLEKNGLRLVSGGTDNHLVLIDLRSINLRGLRAQNLLEQAGIISNRNPIPYDINPAYNPSGLRLGTAAITSRGMKEKEMEEIAEIIVQILKNKTISKIIKSKVRILCRKFPLNI